MKRHSSSRHRSQLFLIGGFAVLVIAVIILIRNVSAPDSDIAGISVNANQDNISNEQKNCEEIQDPTQKDDCYSALAKKTGNDSMCKFVSQDMQGKCYFEVATTTRNVGSCRNIRDEIGKSLCLQQLATDMGNPQLCLQAGVPDIRITCVANIAKKREDINLCNLMTNEEDRLTCEERVKGTDATP